MASGPVFPFHRGAGVCSALKEHFACDSSEQVSRLLLLKSQICGQISRGNHAKENVVKSIILAGTIAIFAMGSALAQETCESKAVGKDGKALAGAAKTSFMKKCMADSCAPKAVSKDGKPLAGAAKTSFMKKCEMGA